MYDRLWWKQQRCKYCGKSKQKNQLWRSSNGNLILRLSRVSVLYRQLSPNSDCAKQSQGIAKSLLDFQVLSCCWVFIGTVLLGAGGSSSWSLWFAGDSGTTVDSIVVVTSSWIFSWVGHSAKLILCEGIVGGSLASYDDVIERSLVQAKVKFDGFGFVDETDFARVADGA